MRSQPLNLLGGSNVDSNVAWSVEDTINYFVEKASSDGFLTPLEFRDAPGLKPYAMGPTSGGGEDPVVQPGPVRGSHDCEGRHFQVMGSTLYQISPARIAIPLGTVPGTQRLNMAHNQIVGGNEVIITTGTPNAYVYNTVTQVFGRITDPGYPGGGSVDYIDTYLVSVEPLGRYWFWSDQANATSYNTLNRTEAESDPDSIVALAVNSFEVVVFGQQTVEFFYNAGGINGSTFKSKKVMNNQGCAARDSVVKLDNSLFWLGVDGILYRLNGYRAQPISSPQFTQRIQGKNWAKAYAYAFEDLGHVVYIITFPDGETFAYDVPTQAMTRLESYGLTRWRASTLIKTGGRWIAGDFQAGKLYELDWTYPMEGEGTPMVRERISGNVANARNKIEVPLLELQFQTGSKEVMPVAFETQPEGPSISGDAPDGVIFSEYSFAYTVTAGASPVTTVTLRSGTLPPGLTLSSAGVLSGTLTGTIATYSFTVRVTDANGLWDDHDDTIAVSLGDAIPIPTAMTLLYYITGGGATNMASELLGNSFPAVTDATEPWARIFVRAHTGDGIINVPPETRNIIYNEIDQGGDVFWDSAWFGNPAHQSDMETALGVAGLSAYSGTIQDDMPPVIFGTYWSFLRASDPFVLPTDFATYSGRSIEYRFGSRFDLLVSVEVPDPAELPVGAVKLDAYPGYYVADGQLYVCDWTPT